MKGEEKQSPELDLRLLEKSLVIPWRDQSADAVVMSTVLCCLLTLQEKEDLMEEIYRVLVPGGILYLTDFLLCSAPHYEEKYKKGMLECGVWGTYQTNEGLVVRHYKPKNGSWSCSACLKNRCFSL